MKIAVLSGKGGTGKTTVAACIARVVPECVYVDCDVEEPDGALFLKPAISEETPVEVPVPVVAADVCDLCGECAAACRFHALAVLRDRVLVFPELCHHCGACMAACPARAMSEKMRRIGVIRSDADGSFLEGRLDIGEPSGVPVIRALKRHIPETATAVLDCAPGAACTVSHTIDGCDYLLLVAEPTPFGRHDLEAVLTLARETGVPAGLVINKAGPDDAGIRALCRAAGVPTVLEIPFSRNIAEGYSRGYLPVDIGFHWRLAFRRLAADIEGWCGA